MFKDIKFTEAFSENDLFFLAAYKYNGYTFDEYCVQKDATSIASEVAALTDLMTKTLNEAMLTLKNKI